MKMNRLGKLLLAAALALSWAAPLCAMPAPQADAHACCPGDEAPAAPAADASCCEAAPALPPAPAVAPQPVAIAPSAAPAPLAAAPVFAGHVADASSLPPDSPPGASSGLSPPAAGL